MNALRGWRWTLVGGVSLIVATVLFAAVFGYLAVTFEYPDVLERSADQVLPALLALGNAGRAVWFIYGFIPLLLVPTALGVHVVSRKAAPRLGRLVMWFAGLSAVSMMIGLLRWPTLHWALASSWTTADAATRAVIASRFTIANLYLGNVIGEFVGELFLNAFFLSASLVVVLARPGRRWLTVVAVVTSVLGWAAMLRNITPAVSRIAELNNTILPLWMLTLGIVLATTPEEEKPSPRA